jgi:hypothetical protein
MSADSVEFVIGGERIAVPALNFAALKKAWAAIRALPEETDLVGQASRVVEIVAAGLSGIRAELTVAEIEARLKAEEIVGLVAAAPKLLDISGLLPRETSNPGEAPKPGEHPAGR